MDERRYESGFIPCGDSLEMMQETGGTAAAREQEEQIEESPED